MLTIQQKLSEWKWICCWDDFGL